MYLEKRMIWAIITIPIAIIGVIFLGILLFALLDEVFWIEVQLFGWDPFYTFVIIMAAVFLGLTAVIYFAVLKKLGPAPARPTP